MKIRSGFVSNSSSSSFIVAFPKKPQNAWECHELMFGPTANDGTHDYKVNGTELGKFEAAVAVFKELCGRRPLSKKRAQEVVLSSPIEGLEETYPARPEFDIEEEYDRQCDKYWDEREHINKMELNRFFDENSGCFIFSFEYGDENGRFWALMEHSGIFNKLSHLKIDKH